MIFANTRNLRGHVTGVQRYTKEIINRISNEISTISPRHWSTGGRGHAWEQTVLPFLVKGELLWSPSNTGPIAVNNQVVTIHDVVPLDHPEWLNSKFAAWYNFMWPRLAKQVRKIITDSEFTRVRIVELLKVPEERIVCIPLGVDPRFRPLHYDQVISIGKELGLPSQRYVLSLGSLEPRKNLARLIQAWEKLADLLDDDVWLVIAGAVGKSSVFREVEGLDRLPPRIHLAGHVPDEYLPGLYSGAITFVYLSEYEGFGLPPLEAMASGTPAITGNLTSLPEVVGDAGLKIDPFDLDAIVDAIRLLVEQENFRAVLRANSLAWASNFSWDRTAQLTLDVLRNSAP